MQRLLALIFILSFSSALEAAVILKVKGKKALVDLEGVEAELGDRFEAINLYGKAMGVLEIKKIKRGKAVAILVKGKMGASWILEPAAKGAVASFEETEGPTTSPPSDIGGGEEVSTPEDRNIRASKRRFSSSGIGVLGGMDYNWIFKKAVGLSYRGSLIVDFPLAGIVASRLFVSYITFHAAGKGCSSGNCQLFIHYPGVGGLIRGKFFRHSSFQPWIGFGGFLLYPIPHGQATLGLNKKSFDGFHGTVTAALGLDVYFAGFYIPVQLDMNMVNPFVFSPSFTGSSHLKPLFMSFQIGINLSL